SVGVCGRGSGTVILGTVTLGSVTGKGPAGGVSDGGGGPNQAAWITRCKSHTPLIGVGHSASDPQFRDLSNSGDDVARKAGEVTEELGAFRLQPVDVGVVLLAPPGAFVELPRLEHLVVVDTRHRRCDEVTE